MKFRPIKRRSHILLTNLAVRVNQLSARRTVLTDIFTTPDFFSHATGEQSATFGALYGDGHVSLKKPDSTFFKNYWPYPDITEEDVRDVLEHFNE